MIGVWFLMVRLLLLVYLLGVGFYCVSCIMWLGKVRFCGWVNGVMYRLREDERLIWYVNEVKLFKGDLKYKFFYFLKRKWWCLICYGIVLLVGLIFVWEFFR